MEQTKATMRRHRVQDSLAPFRWRARWRQWRVFLAFGWIALLALGALLVFVH